MEEALRLANAMRDVIYGLQHGWINDDLTSTKAALLRTRDMANAAIMLLDYAAKVKEANESEKADA